MGGVYLKTKFWNDLQKGTFKEFYARAEKYLRVENAEEALGKADFPTKNPRIRKRRKGNLRYLSRMIKNSIDLRIALH